MTINVTINQYHTLVNTIYKTTYVFEGKEYNTPTALRKGILSNPDYEDGNFKLKDMVELISKGGGTIEGLKVPEILLSYNTIRKEVDRRNVRFDSDITEFTATSDDYFIVTDIGMKLESTKHHTRGPFVVDYCISNKSDSVELPNSTEAVKKLNELGFNISRPQFNMVISQCTIPKTLSSKYPLSKYIDKRYTKVKKTMIVKSYTQVQI